MVCNMCGSEEEEFEALVEGTTLKVCASCAKFGKVLKRLHLEAAPEKAGREHAYHSHAPAHNIHSGPFSGEAILVVRKDYPTIVKKARESKELKQEDAAKALNIRASLLHNIESGSFEPNLELARKLERFFGIKLVEQHVEKHIPKPENLGSGEFTLGDFVKKR